MCGVVGESGKRMVNTGLRHVEVRTQGHQQTCTKLAAVPKVWGDAANFHGFRDARGRAECVLWWIGEESKLCTMRQSSR